MEIPFRNNQRQALSHFGEANELFGAIHALVLRANSDIQLKALLPLVIPKITERITNLIELGITQWKNETPDAKLNT